MADVRDPTSLIEAAQNAVANGDDLEAERLLRQAADLQESTLGPSHPDLAPTLNNLAFVCERISKFDEAERGYRRAHAIAVASLTPGHPIIKTSLSNLVEFCEARGIPIWTKPETPLEDEPLPDEETPSDDADVEPAALETGAPVAELPVPTSRLPLGLMAAAAVVVGAIIVVVFARQGQGRTEEAQPVAAETTTPTPVPARVPESTAASTPPPPEPATASVTVLTAQLCSAIEKQGSPDWQCSPASGDLPPGTYMFYTRLQTKAATTVEHRWYRGDRVHQTMRLRVSANPGSGYRTFSATTVSPERAGEWTVELRASDGSVLDHASFRVR